MNTGQKVLLGVVAGASAAAAAARAVRLRHAIDFDGRVVVISGGSRGLGLVLARQLSEEGARVCLLARDEQELRRAAAEFDEAREVITVPCDVRRRTEAHAAIESVLARRGSVDVLVNCAGIIQVGPLEHMSEDDFEDAMATHFWGPLYLMQACLPHMRRRSFGRIVNISSIGGRVAVPHLAPYCASKFALSGLSDAIRAEVDKDGIRVTTVAPGLMRTGSPRNALMKGRHQAEYAWFAISSSVPGMTTSAESAARQIVEACRYGDPELTITLPARAAVLVNALVPSLVAMTAMLASRVLPGPAGPDGDRTQAGRDSQSRWAPSVATALTERAAVANNEL